MLNWKKKCAGTGELISAIVVIFTLFVVLAMFLNIQRDFNAKSRVDDIVRSYALIAETQGGLTPSNISSMVGELNSIGDLYKSNTDLVDSSCIDADIAGSLTYGQAGKVELNCFYANYSSRLMARLFGNNTKLMTTVDITKTYTSKY